MFRRDFLFELLPTNKEMLPYVGHLLRPDSGEKLGFRIAYNLEWVLTPCSYQEPPG